MSDSTQLYPIVISDRIVHLLGPTKGTRILDERVFRSAVAHMLGAHNGFLKAVVAAREKGGVPAKPMRLSEYTEEMGALVQGLRLGVNAVAAYPENPDLIFLALPVLPVNYISTGIAPRFENNEYRPSKQLLGKGLFLRREYGPRALKIAALVALTDEDVTICSVLSYCGPITSGESYWQLWRHAGAEDLLDPDDRLGKWLRERMEFYVGLDFKPHGFHVWCADEEVVAA